MSYPSRTLQIACSKLMGQENYFRLWYYYGQNLQEKPKDGSEGIKSVLLQPTEALCKNERGTVHVAITRFKLLVTFHCSTL